MRPILAALSLALASTSAAHGADVIASAPRDVSVTVYRAPFRGAGGFDLNQLGGFALISETRTVSLPAGESRIRLEGVADGIDPASAILTGLPSGVVEKNRDAHLLSPSALVELTLGRRVVLVRSRPGQKADERVEGRIVSDADGGVVFQTSAGVEALRCSGLSETLGFDNDTTGLSAVPTISVLTRSGRPLSATVTLSYLAGGFDWAADYVVKLSADGKTVDLGAWLTLANGNGTGFPDARTQAVAGRLNHTTGEVQPIDRGEPILAQCWPRGSTSDTPEQVRIVEAHPLAFDLNGPPLALPPAPAPPPPPPPASVEEVLVTGAALEQLGDLKLYRTPARTTVASRQSKQVRLLDRVGVPVERIYGADLDSNGDHPPSAASVLLRTRNDVAHHLGLPLPSGRLAVFQSRQGEPMLVARTAVRDLAENELVEWRLGEAPDVAVTQTHEQRSIDREGRPFIPVLPGVVWAVSGQVNDIGRVEITNASAEARTFELRLSLPPGSTIVGADHAVGQKDGRPIFNLLLPPNDRVIVRYQTGSPPAA